MDKTKDGAKKLAERKLKQKNKDIKYKKPMSRKKRDRKNKRSAKYRKMRKRRIQRQWSAGVRDVHGLSPKELIAELNDKLDLVKKTKVRIITGFRHGTKLRDALDAFVHPRILGKERNKENPGVTTLILKPIKQSETEEHYPVSKKKRETYLPVAVETTNSFLYF